VPITKSVQNKLSVDLKAPKAEVQIKVELLCLPSL